MKHFNLLFFYIICTLSSLTIFGQTNQKQIASVNLKKFEINKFNKKHYELGIKPEYNTSDIFNKDWDNRSLNPYKTGPINGTQHDIRDYVNPVKTHLVNSKYGYRPRFKRNHQGVDLQAAIGDTIYAAFSGKVRIAQHGRSGYGNCIVIRHPNMLETLYGHLSKIIVKENEYVKEGDPIGLAGNTGRSTGPHLHFEIRYNGHCINPEQLIDFELHSPRMGIYTHNSSKHNTSTKSSIIHHKMHHKVHHKTNHKKSKHKRQK